MAGRLRANASVTIRSAESREAGTPAFALPGVLMAGFRRILRAGLVAAAAVATLTLAACSDYDGVLPKHMRPLDQATRELVERKGMDERSPILIRLFKEEATLEVWKQQRATGKYVASEGI